MYNVVVFITFFADRRGVRFTRIEIVNLSKGNTSIIIVMINSNQKRSGRPNPNCPTNKQDTETTGS